MLLSKGEEMTRFWAIAVVIGALVVGTATPASADTVTVTYSGLLNGATGVAGDPGLVGVADINFSDQFKESMVRLSGDPVTLSYVFDITNGQVSSVPGDGTFFGGPATATINVANLSFTQSGIAEITC